MNNTQTSLPAIAGGAPLPVVASSLPVVASSLPVIASVAKQSGHRRQPGLLRYARNGWRAGLGIILHARYFCALYFSRHSCVASSLIFYPEPSIIVTVNSHPFRGAVPCWGNRPVTYGELSPVGENVPQLTGNFPLLGKTSRNLRGTFPSWGKRPATYGELSPVGETVPKLPGNFPLLGKLSRNFRGAVPS
jgi:hypothetical protein